MTFLFVHTAAHLDIGIGHRKGTGAFMCIIFTYRGLFRPTRWVAKRNKVILLLIYFIFACLSALGAMTKLG
jgi:hypothetical protein